jgi:Fe-S-cluster containining protein
MHSAVYYQCQRCANCCKWPGVVRLREGEAGRIAEFLGLPVFDFTERYTQLLPARDGLTLISKPNHECIFLEGNACGIQSVKPAQCAGFPNAWNFPGWREKCEAIPITASPWPRREVAA